MRTSTLRPAACLWLAGVFLAVEAVYHAHGVRFDATPLDSFWQFLDPLLLRVDLIRSVWYLHGQPPAFNLLLSPSFVLYEHWLFYTFPVATLVVMAALALAWFRDRPSPARALLFHSLVLAMCGIQSTYAQAEDPRAG